MKKILLVLFSFLFLAVGCAAPGTVGVTPAKGLLAPVIERCDAYIALYPEALEAAQVEQYKAAKVAIGDMEPDTRVEAAVSWTAVNYICAIHDAFVSADTKVDEVHRSTYLRSTVLLRKMYQEAFKAKGAVPPVAESQSTSLESSFRSMDCTDGSCSK
jgi:hypothetical protein